MKTFEERPDAVDARSLDRLVDGDLDHDERKKLILRLENDPEGWRRCALAFLEDQTWRKALTSGVPIDSKQTVPTSAPVSLPTPRRRKKTWFGRASIAASLMASTFAAGFAAGGLTKPDRGAEVAGSQPSTAVPTPVITRSDEIHEVGSLELVDQSAGESPPERIPIHAGPGLDDRWLRNQPPSVPEYIRARWERQGYQVAERRNVVSVELGDGRRVSIPVDEVEVDYVGQQPL